MDDILTIISTNILLIKLFVDSVKYRFRYDFRCVKRQFLPCEFDCKVNYNLRHNGDCTV